MHLSDVVSYLAIAVVVVAVFIGMAAVINWLATDQGPYQSFASECVKSTIRTQHAEQQGQRVMVVQCERAK